MRGCEFDRLSHGMCSRHETRHMPRLRLAPPRSHARPRVAVAELGVVRLRNTSATVMSHFSVFYVPLNGLVPGAALTEMGRRLWRLGMPFMEAPDFGNLPEPDYEFELSHEGMGIVFSEFGDPIPNQIGDLRCPHCDQDVLHNAYEVWQDDTLRTATILRRFACSGCGTLIGGTELKASEPYDFATSYLYVSEIDPDYWPDKVKSDIEEIIGPCHEYRETVP